MSLLFRLFQKKKLNILAQRKAVQKVLAGTHGEEEKN